MTTRLDETHDPGLRSWVESANDAATDFPIQNLPFGVFRRAASREAPRVGVAIGDQIVDVARCADERRLGGDVAAAVECCRQPSLNALMALGGEHVRGLRRALSRFLRAGGPLPNDSPTADAAPPHGVLVPMREAELGMPAQVGDYSDFYASLHHATTVGTMFRPDNPLLPNYKWVPIGYHGRASSIVPSGTSVRRPAGQTHDGTDAAPVVGPTRRLDYELEVGVFIGAGNALGTPIAIDDAERHVFGLCLLNDWSARDIQSWEYQPLGPFLSKSFMTTVSPWVVTMDALAPYRAPAYARAADDPKPLPYLSSAADIASGGVDITLEVFLTTASMRQQLVPPFRVSVVRFTEMYWTVAQMVTHHASNGCNLRAGDLLGSGTVSGTTPLSRGCLLERTMRGSEPLELPGGERRGFLLDGDEVTMRGYCERRGHPRIGFGECSGRIVGPTVPV